MSASATPREPVRANSGLPAILGGMTSMIGEQGDSVKWVKLAPTAKEAKAKYKEDPERALFILCGHKDISAWSGSSEPAPLSSSEP